MPTSELDQHRDSYLEWLHDRPSMLENNKDLGKIGQLLYAEVLELLEAIDEGDLEEIWNELADVFNFTMTIAWLNDVDVIARGRDKIKKRAERYPVELFSGDIPYQEAVVLSRTAS